MSVSVVMATYNREKYLPGAIESVIGQTHQDFELIVVNDGSTDSTAAVLDRYARSDSRIVALHQANAGVAAARNLGLAHCRFPLVAMTDDDDVLRPTRLAVQVAYLVEHPEKSAVFSYAYMVDAEGKIISKSTPSADFDRAKALRRPNLALDIIHGTAMFRKEAVVGVGGYRLRKLEDRDLIGRLWTAGCQIGVLPSFLYDIRRHSQNTSRDRAEDTLRFGDFIDFNAVRRLDGLPEVSYEEYGASLRSAPWPERFRNMLNLQARFAYDRATLSYSQHHMAAAFVHAMAAVTLRPTVMGRRIAQKLVWRN